MALLDQRGIAYTEVAVRAGACGVPQDGNAYVAAVEVAAAPPANSARYAPPAAHEDSDRSFAHSHGPASPAPAKVAASCQVESMLRPCVPSLQPVPVPPAWLTSAPRSTAHL